MSFRELKTLRKRIKQGAREMFGRGTSPVPPSAADFLTDNQAASTSINPGPDFPGKNEGTPTQSHGPRPDIPVTAPIINVVPASQGEIRSGDDPTQSTCSLPDQVTSSHVRPSHESLVVLTGADPVARPGSAPPTIGPTSISGTWGSLKGFVQVLDKVSGGFGPLKVVMDELVKCIDMYEGVVRAQEDYAALRSKLEKLFTDLSSHFSGNVPPTMTAGMNNLCSAIEDELDRISNKEERRAGRRILEAKQDMNEVMGCYDRIHGHLERLKLNADLNMWKIVDEQASEARLDRLAPSMSARFNSAEAAQVGRRECTPKTREEVLATLGTWRHDKKQGNMFWLNGMAGTGKTTIANSLCAMLHRSHELGASFFCTRLLPECRNVKLIFPTIAYQLARFSRPFYHALSSALQENPDLHTNALPNQLEGLIVGPMRNVAHALPLDLVVVIDALDECEDSNGISLLLQLLAKFAADLPLKVFVSSRPEPQIRAKIGDTKSQLILHELDKSIVKGDIATYLRIELKGMSLSELQLTALIEDAGILFIYAATAVRYITTATSVRLQQKRLQTVLGAASSVSANKNKEIDALYTAVLASAFDNPDLEDDEKKTMKLVLETVVCAQEPLTTSALARLLQLGEAEYVEAALEPLWSVLHISGADSLVTTLHTSFPDYMLDINRSKEYACKADAHNGRLAELCFRRIENNEQQFNICGLESSYLLDEQVPDIEERTNQMIATELSYACCYWAVHLQLGGVSSERMGLLDELLSKRLLLWMEVLNLKRRMSTGPVALGKAREWCKIGNGSQKIQDLVHEAWRYATMFATNAVSRSTPHIYVSMLASWPREGLLARCYLQRTRGLAEVGGTGIARRQLAPLGVFQNGGRVESAVFSPDGMRIVSSCDDGTIRVWDAQTGKLALDPLEGHTEAVHSVAFSPNGMRIVSGSEDETIRVWDAETGQPALDPLRGHTDAIWSVAFSPDGLRIASGSNDKTIRIWDSQTGQAILHPLKGHTSVLQSVAFSPSGMRIVSGSNDKTIRIWDATTGQPLLDPLTGHTGQVWSVAFSPDGSRIVSGSDDDTVRVWNSETGEPVLDALQGHEDGVWSVAFSPDGMNIISGSSDNTILRWNAQTGQPVLGQLEGHTDLVSSVAFSPDGTRIVSGSRDRTIRVWDAQIRRQALGPFEGHISAVSLVAFSPDGMRIVSSSLDGTLRIWDAHTGQPVLEPLQGHTGTVWSVAFSPDGMRIASGAADSTIWMWDAKNGQPILDPLKGHSDEVMSVAFSPNGTRMVSGSDDKTVRVWHAETGQPLLDPLNGHTQAVQSVAFSPNGTRIVSSSNDKTIRVWDAQTGQPMLDPLKGHTEAVHSVAFSHSGAHIVSGSGDSTIRVWDTETGQPMLSPFKGHTERVWSVAFSPDSKHLISGSDDKTIRMWNLQTGQPELRPLKGHARPVYSIAFSPDGSRIVSGSEDMTIWVWDAQTGKPILRPREGHVSPVHSVAYAPDGMCFASGSGDNAICVWSSETGKALLDPLDGHTDTVLSIVFSPDGSHIVSASSDMTIRMWDLQTGQAVQTLIEGHTGPINSVAFSPNGMHIVSGSDDETICIWDAQCGEQVLGPLQGHTDSVSSVAFSPDGMQIVSSSADRTIRIWDTQTGQPVLNPLEGHSDLVNSAIFSPDGLYIVSGSWDMTIRVWDAKSGKQVLDPLEGHTGDIRAVAFSPDGKHVVSGSDDGTMRLWDAQSGALVQGPLEGHTNSVCSVVFSPDGRRIVSGSEDSTVRVWDICHLTIQPSTTPLDARHSSSHLVPSDNTGGHILPASQNPYNTFAPWILDEHGCVVDNDQRLLLWIPPDLRDRLITPLRPILISTQGSIELNFDHAMIGESWVSCFSPA